MCALFLQSGIGESMIYLSTTVTLHQNFHKNRTLAAGIAMCGINCGNIVGPLWVNYLLETYGWRGGFLLHAGLMLQATVLATQYHREGKQLHSPEQTGLWAILKNSFDFSLFKNPSFLVFCAALFGHNTCQFAAMAVVPNAVVFYGGTLHEAALVLSILGGALFVSRLSGGFLVNLGCINKIIVIGIAVTGAGVVVAMLAMSKTYMSTAILLSFYGLNMGRWA